MNFVKMHGLGNDFIVVEDFEGVDRDYPALARDLCRRRWSVGADGLVVLQKDAHADFCMRIFNPDGGEAEMCGNALRCVAKRYGARHNLHTMTVKAGATLQEAEVLDGGCVRVNMGVPVLDSKNIPVSGSSRLVINESIKVEGGETLFFSAVSMGNPHCVIFVENLEEIPWRRWGSFLEWHELFPRGVNVEFAKIIDHDWVEVKVWERGAGETLACGTGACAVAVAGIEQGILNEKVEVNLPGGTLRIHWQPGGDVYMEGPAEEIYHGIIPLP